MATADRVQNKSSKKNFQVEHMAGVREISEILETVQEYLNSWSKEKIVNLQKIDGGWAPFDESQRPLRVFCADAMYCNRDAIHRHCVALRDASMPPTPELMELEEFFYNACKLIEKCKDPASRMRTPETRTPSTASQKNALRIGSAGGCSAGA